MTTISDNILKKLDEYEKNNSPLPMLQEFYKKLIIIQEGAKQEIDLHYPVFTAEAVIAHMTKGKPLLGFNQLVLDWHAIKTIFNEMLSLFDQYQQLFGSLPEDIRRMEISRIINRRTVRAWYKGHKIPLNIEISEAAEVLLNNIFHAAIKPFLVKEAQTLTNVINQEGWRRSYCPVCGGSADFGYLQKDNGARFLVCNRCDTEWLFQRLQCPFCDNNNQNKLSYLTDDKGLYRLYVCEECHSYLKVIDKRATSEDVLITLERFLTFDIDRQAQEKGYRPGDTCH